MIAIPGKFNIPDTEVRFTFSRSSGPGGQNVNKVNSRVTLWFDLNASMSLTDGQKQKIRRRLAGRINDAGILSISSTIHRTQKANREETVRRFQSLLDAALTDKPVRKKTRIPRKEREKRIRLKKKRSVIKSLRGNKLVDS